MAAAADAPAETAAGGFSRAAVLEVVGAGVALAGWIAVVGGAHMWARLSAAHFAPTPSVIFQPRQALLVEGLQTLLFPLIVGGFVAVLAWYTWRSPSSPDEDFEAAFQRWLRTDEGRFETALWWANRPPGLPPGPEPPDPLPDLRGIYARRRQESPRTSRGDDATVPWWRELWDFLAQSPGFLWTAAVLFVAAILFVGLNYQSWTSTFGTLLLTALALVAGFFVVPRSRSQRGRALILFAIVVLWAGAADILVVSGTRHPSFELALVHRKSTKADVAGFFVAQNGGDVYLAQRLEKLHKYRVLMVPKEDVDSFSVGPSLKVYATDEFKSAALARKYFSAGSRSPG
jgi:hypothetical protein